MSPLPATRPSVETAALYLVISFWAVAAAWMGGAVPRHPELTATAAAGEILAPAEAEAPVALQTAPEMVPAAVTMATARLAAAALAAVSAGMEVSAAEEGEG